MKKSRIRTATLGAMAAFALICAFGAILPASQQKSVLKVFISVDMEGISGIVHSDQTTSGTAEYAAGRKWMAQDVNAAVEGALEAGPPKLWSTTPTAPCAISTPTTCIRAPSSSAVRPSRFR